jgi:hypothetical protein
MASRSSAPGCDEMDLIVSAAPAPLVAALLGVLTLVAMWEPRPTGSTQAVRAGSAQHADDK